LCHEKELQFLYLLSKSTQLTQTHGFLVPQILENKVQSICVIIEGASEWQEFTTLLRMASRLAEKYTGEDRSENKSDLITRLRNTNVISCK
jgi:hypothetical protein